jgi:hypothetical protein
MTQPDFTQLAHQGDAIAKRLNQVFQSHRVTVRVSLKNHCLKVLLEALPVPEPQMALALLRQESERLGFDRFEVVQVYGRILGADRLSWSERLTLEPTLATPDDANSESSELRDRLLRQRAMQGNLIAIVTLLNHALAHKQLQSQVSLEAGQLAIVLTGDAIPDLRTVVMLLDREIVRWQSPLIHTVQVEVRTIDNPEPNWRTEFKLDSRQLDAREVRSLGPVTASAVAPIVPAQPRPQAISQSGWSALITGFVLAILLMAIGLLKMLFYGFLVLVHEVGHAVTLWLFGTPAIPSVDILHGGGVTIVFGRSPILVALLYLGMAYLFHLCRCYPRVQGVLALFISIYSLCLFTSLNALLSTAMGHGMELLAIVTCLYLAASGYLCRFPGDRSIYAMLGFFTLFSDLEFAWKLMHNLDFRAWYEEGKGGMDHDFVILATQYFRVDLAAIAQVFLMSALMAAIGAFLIFRYQLFWLRTVEKSLLIRKV